MLCAGPAQPGGSRGRGAQVLVPAWLRRACRFPADPLLPCFPVHAFSIGRPLGSGGRTPCPRRPPTLLRRAARGRVLRLTLRSRAPGSRLRRQLRQVVGLLCPRDWDSLGLWPLPGAHSLYQLLAAGLGPHCPERAGGFALELAPCSWSAGSQ